MVKKNKLNFINVYSGWNISSGIREALTANAEKHTGRQFRRFGEITNQEKEVTRCVEVTLGAFKSCY